MCSVLFSVTEAFLVHLLKYEIFQTVRNSFKKQMHRIKYLKDVFCVSQNTLEMRKLSPHFQSILLA
jgi:hypothetical protein